MGAEAAAQPTDEPEVLNADDLVDLTSDLPEVNEQAIQAEAGAAAPQPPQVQAPQAPVAKPAPSVRATAAAKAPSQPALVDMKGRTFNPLIHETNADGTPVINTYGARVGKLRIRRQALKEYKSTSTIASDEVPQPAPAAGVPSIDPSAAAMQRKAAAATLAGIQVLIMRKAFGSAIAKDEAHGAALSDSWEAVLAYHDVQSFNPWVALVTVSGGLVVAALDEPETRSRLQVMSDWLSLKAHALWLRLRGRRAAVQATASA